MMIKNIKYYAGIFDADGSFDVQFTKRKEDVYYSQVRCTLYQVESRREVLDILAKEFDVPVKESKGCLAVTLNCSKAVKFIQQVKNHLVIKKPVAEKVLELDKTFCTKDQTKELRNLIKCAREQSSTEKNFPSRKWMAGYVDGDGSINSYFNKSTGLTEFRLSIVSHKSQKSAIDLILKCFGGRIHKDGDCIRYALTLNYSSREKLSYFGKHLLLKKRQYDFVINIISNQLNLKKNGATNESNLVLHKTLQQLNSTNTPATTKSSDTLKGDIIV